MHWLEHLEMSPLEGNLKDFSEPVTLHKVNETPLEAQWDRLVKEYHYLGYDSVIGGRVKYLVAMGTQVVGAISFCSAAYQLGLRDRYIGWDEATRQEYLPHLVNNNRFLILPWVRVKDLASHVLALSLKHVRTDWKRQYDVEPYMAETFIDPSRYLGTSYKAANWTWLGTTKGYGRIGEGFVFHGHVKELYVNVFNRRFASIFRPDTGRLSNTREELVKMMIGMPHYNGSILAEMGVEGFNSETLTSLLAEHLARYLPFLGRREHRPHMVAMVKGLLSDMDRKSCEPIAYAFEGAGEVRNMANFMTRSTFDGRGMMDELQMEVASLLSHPDGMITCDGCDFPKKGRNSVGVARQYCGTLGKTENCQASVMVGYASPEGYGLTDCEIYVPEKWFGDDFEALRKRLKMPGDLVFKTKIEIASELIAKAHRNGEFKGRYVGVDSFFGRDHSFLDSLPSGLVYFADIPANHLVFHGRPEMAVPEYKGKGRRPGEAPSFPPRQVRDLAQDPEIPWQDVVLGNGAKGPVIAKDKCIKVTECRDGKPGRDVWLYVRQWEDGKIKYALCNASMDTDPFDLRIPATMRWSVEQCFKECKEYLGMDHYETRSWPAWHRHMLFVFLAHLFISKLRRMFSVKVDTPGCAPVVDAPVPLKISVRLRSKLTAINRLTIRESGSARKGLSRS